MKRQLTKEIKKIIKQMNKTTNIYTLYSLNKELETLINKYTIKD